MESITSPKVLLQKPKQMYFCTLPLLKVVIITEK